MLWRSAHASAQFKISRVVSLIRQSVHAQERLCHWSVPSGGHLNRKTHTAEHNQRPKHGPFLQIWDIFCIFDENDYKNLSYNFKTKQKMFSGARKLNQDQQTYLMKQG